MSKRRVAFVASLSGIVGIIIGIVGASWYWLNFYADFMNHELVVRTQADIVTKVAVLKRLREGHYEGGTKLLETLLDGDLIGAGALARDGTKFYANARRAVEDERRAREISGYEPSDEPTIRAAVQEAFRIIPQAVEPVPNPALKRNAAQKRVAP